MQYFVMFGNDFLQNPEEGHQANVYDSCTQADKYTHTYIHLLNVFMDWLKAIQIEMFCHSYVSTDTHVYIRMY